MLLAVHCLNRADSLEGRRANLDDNETTTGFLVDAPSKAEATAFNNRN